jgi:hypothetical protein
LFKVVSFSYKTAFFASWFAMMLVNVPEENEKKNTPLTINNMQITLSVVLVPEISPYPTVEIVVTV